jgi:site-specific DNA recombinase
LRDQAQADAERATSAVERLGPAITPESLRRFALAARRKLRNEDGTYRRDHLRALAQRVEVVDPSEIRILGTKTELLRTLVAAAGVESAVAGVRRFIPKWRTRHDSNVWPSPSESIAHGGDLCSVKWPNSPANVDRPRQR